MGRATRWLKSLMGIKKEKETANGRKENGRRGKKRWSFANSVKDSVPPLGQIPANDSAWLRDYISEKENEQSMTAISVAAATAAAADVAVKAAQAAVEMVRLTSRSRGALFFYGRETRAAIKIQTVFRGHLARKALKALKGLVKLQAHVRGYLVRKQAAATLRSMQALIRAQASARSQRASRSLNDGIGLRTRHWQQKTMRRIDESSGEDDSMRTLGFYDQSYNALDESPKTVEIDTLKIRSRSRRSNPASASDHYGGDLQDAVISSPYPWSIPASLSIPSCRNLHGDESRISSSDKFLRPHEALTPAKSVCGDEFFGSYSKSDFPNYMANTRSFQAKLRSQSAPKQRTESAAPGKRIPLSEILALRNGVMNTRTQR
ncbi:hypothetical protein Nepgr_019481 [Nepenthes gracilis]|uniref:DUF4005 domain-containing protein n=1 Tax=Nepenthes gracilis TaxID=150966 RepID=A0AAD3XVA6_NEPGR|nr:hypothetical protein Nepgr_019481 [Nepenthes gracilis]